MCLIIHKPQGENIPDWIVHSAHATNPDGFGIMAQGKARKYADIKPGKIIKLLRDFQDIDTAVHFRMATHGKINKANTHPFKLSDKSYLMHNGVLGKYCPDKGTTADISDTRNFIDKFLEPVIKQHGTIPTAIVEAEILGNKLCVMRRDGSISKYGSGWETHYGLHFSNSYAWDSPSWNAGYSKSMPITGRYPATIDEDTEFYTYSDSIRLGELMVSELLEHTDILPFNDNSLIAYEDIELQDQLLDNEITAQDFLEFCTDRTLLDLYKYAVGYGLIQS